MGLESGGYLRRRMAAGENFDLWTKFDSGWSPPNVNNIMRCEHLTTLRNSVNTNATVVAKPNVTELYSDHPMTTPRYPKAVARLGDVASVTPSLKGGMR